MSANWRASSGVEEVQTWHFKDTTPLSADLAGAASICDEVDNWLTGHLQPSAPSYLTLVSYKATEVVATWEGAIPEQARKIKNLAGTASSLDGKVPHGTCIWSKATVNEVFKGNHGGWHCVDPYSSAYLDGGGQWISTSAAWISMGQTNTDLLAGHDWSTGLHHMSYVLYSLTRHKRGAENYYFDVTGLTRDPTPHFLRTRLTAP